jgi:hypothetical protein
VGSVPTGLGKAVDAFSPSAFFQGSAESDEVVREVLRRYDPVLVELGTDEYNLRRFRAAAFNFVPLLLSLGLDLKRRAMLEVGCGRGLKGLAWADMVGRYVGVDLDPREVELGHAIRARAGRRADEIVLGDARDVVREGGVVAEKEVGILVLYAVLEHLLPQERREVLRFARRCYDRGAIVLIAETPNRLFPFDHHTTERHFFQMLPDELAIRHLRRFPGHRVARVVDAADGDSETMAYQLHRYGRAMSYHDFELDFCDGPVDMRVAVDGWHPALLDHQPACNAELELLRYFGANGVAAPRLFCRSWLDMVLWKGAAGTAARSVRVVEPVESRHVSRVVRGEFWSIDRFTTARRGGMEFEVEGPAEGGRVLLMVDADHPEAGVEISVDGRVMFNATAGELNAMRPPTWHQRFVIPIATRGACSVRVGPAKGSKYCSSAGILMDDA